VAWWEGNHIGASMHETNKTQVRGDFEVDKIPDLIQACWLFPLTQVVQCTLSVVICSRETNRRSETAKGSDTYVARLAILSLVGWRGSPGLRLGPLHQLDNPPRQSRMPQRIAKWMRNGSIHR